MPSARKELCRAIPRWLAVALALGLAALAAPAAEPSGAPPLGTAEAVRRLSAEAAGEGRPVEIEGVIVAVADATPAVVLLDATDGVFVRTHLVSGARLRMGDRVAVAGVTAPGDFAPIVVAAKVRNLGPAAQPTPMRTTLAEVASGGFDAKWVEVEGIVRDAQIVPRIADPARKATLLSVAWAETHVRMRVLAELDPRRLVDARIRVRGVCFNLHNSNRQFVSASLLVGDAGQIAILEAPPEDPFALPLRRAGELLQFDPAGFTGHRVRVQGVVTRQRTGDALWIRDGRRGLRVVSAQADLIAPGDRVDVVGFVDRGGFAPSLGAAIFRRVASERPPAPIALGTLAEAAEREADLVSLEARLREVQAEPGAVRLLLDWNGTTIDALLEDAARADLPDDWQPESRIRVAGICVVPPEAAVRDTGLWSVSTIRLLLRDVTDVAVVVPAPWWNAQRANQVLAGSAAVLLAAIVVLVISWRRQVVRRETERKMAEAEFSAILGERNRMARDIHDSLAQGLNAVSMQLELAKNAAVQGAAKVIPHVATAHAIVRGCLAEARESIWNMRSHALEQTDLAGALENVLRQLSAGLAIEATVAVVGPRRRLAPRIENDLLRIGQEAIANAIKHSGASRLEVRLEFEPRSVRLRIVDNGRGFDTAAPGEVGGHYGLAGIRERVAQMHARLTIASSAGGTELTVEVPSPDGNGPGSGAPD